MSFGAKRSGKIETKQALQMMCAGAILENGQDVKTRNEQETRT